MDGLPPMFRGRALSGSHGHILYVEDFDDDAPGFSRPEQEPEPEPPLIVAPVFTAEDLDLAREEGRLQGLEEARAERQAVEGALRTASLAQIADAVASARASAAEMARRQSDEIGRTILALLHACLPATAARLAQEEVLALLREVIPEEAGMDRLSVHVHPSLAGFVAAQGAEWQVVADDKLAPPDARIVWEGGQTRRDWARIWQAIGVALAPCRLPSFDDIVKDIHHGD